MDLATIEANLKSITDKLTVLDDLVNGKKTLVFRCRHSGLHYPADYVREWGRKYGIGLGSSVVSESLNSRYDLEPADAKQARRIQDVMHPLEVTRAELDAIFIPVSQPIDSPVIDMDDPYMEKRVQIIIPKQIKNPQSKIKVYQGVFNA